MAMILSALMMLRHLGEGAAADRAERALCDVLQEKRSVTRDLGGSAGTRAMADAIVAKLQKA
jgi:isocitrate dehydrogenase (NAD+)